MNDLISRQAAIDALKQCYIPGAPYVDAGIRIAIGKILDLPSARPEPTFEQIEEYCHKRCLSIVDNALLHKYACGARMEEQDG